MIVAVVVVVIGVSMMTEVVDDGSHCDDFDGTSNSNLYGGRRVRMVIMMAVIVMMLIVLAVMVMVAVSVMVVVALMLMKRREPCAYAKLADDMALSC